MHSRQDHPPHSGLALDNCRRAVRKSGHDAAPSRELRAILPVHIQLAAPRIGDIYGFFVDSAIVVIVEVEPPPGSQVQPVVHGIATEETAGADSQSRVESSMSVNRNVTVPEGGFIDTT